MVSKCANPACSTPFHYLRDGKVFRIQTPGRQLVSGAKPAARVEHFWLCGQCANTMTLHVEGGKVVTVPLDSTILRRAAAS
jgi:hypothetical protein